MLDHTNSHNIHNAISSAESPAGRSHSNSPDGRQMLLFGPAPAPASPTRQPAKDSETQTPETSGPLSFGSSASAALQSSLANRLLQQFATGGSMEYAETWKLKATPAGRQFWEHTASARRTSGKGYSGWPTPLLHDGRRQCGGTGSTNGTSLSRDAVNWLTGWATASARDWKDGRASQETMNRNSRPLNEQVTMLTGWPTPQTHDAKGPKTEEQVEKMRQAGHGVANLNETVMLTGWATPQHCDGRGATGPASKNRELGRDVLSSSAETAKPAASALNPAMNRWLMGYPQEPPTQGWDTCSPGWQSWGTIQKLLGEYSRKQDGTESAG